MNFYFVSIVSTVVDPIVDPSSRLQRRRAMSLESECDLIECRPVFGWNLLQLKSTDGAWYSISAQASLIVGCATNEIRNEKQLASREDMAISL